MPVLKLEDLYRIKGETLRAAELSSDQKVRITVHMGTCGISSGASEIEKTFIEEIARSKRKDIVLTTSGCAGMCNKEPFITVERMDEEPVKYAELTTQKAQTIFRQHVLEGHVVKDWVFARGWEQKEKSFKGTLSPETDETQHIREIPFYGMQTLFVMRNRGLIKAEEIDAYIARDGYLAAAKALYQMQAAEIVKEVKISGIRGRGGGGFPTGLKWEFAAKSPGSIKYVLCNADEGDPGAFMDRCVLESDPHSVLEGMIIAAKAIGAHKGYIYCRAEYPLAVKTLTLAIDQAHAYGLLGSNILQTGFEFDIEIYRGAGAFVCGEETALMTSIEGKRGMPRPRPPFPAISGLWQKPTILNNVETLSNIPQIILNGGDWYAGLGTPGSRGTKVFALTGDVQHVGLVEVPMGESIGKIIYDIGGGIPKGKRFKAVQLGGPSGGCLPITHLNTPVDYESITRLGAIVGSGGMIVMDEDKCVVDVARFFMDFCKDESCGKCTPCRVGTEKMLAILTRICNAQGQPGDIEKLERYAEVIKNTALCGLGQTAPNPVLSTLRYFREEYEQHIYEKRCPAVVCSAYFKAPCQHACPIGMDIPAYVALAKVGRLEDAYRVLLKTNPFPATCGRVCNHQCESKCRRSTLDDPVHIKHLKRFVTDNASPPPVHPVVISRKYKIAVIGAGPSGLTAAKDLVLRGYPVTVYESLAEPGGMMRWGIPAYRLPRPILSREIEDILKLGVTLHCNTCIGRDIAINSLMTDYDAVYLAIGAQNSSKAVIDGQALEGVSGAVEFLRTLNGDERPEVGRNVAVIGGGNTAVDAAQCALRLGAEKVCIYYRRTLMDMPALPDEIAAAEKEGILIHPMVAPIRILGRNNHVRGMVLQKMSLGEFDRDGRKKPVPVPGSAFEVALDQIILAIGQQFDDSLNLAELGIKTKRDGFIEIMPGKKTQTNAAMVFAGGDAVTGPATVVEAIRAGHQAAREIDEALRLKNHEAPYRVPEEPTIEIPNTLEEDIQEMPRSPIPEMAVDRRIANFEEVAAGFSRSTAYKEAGRCLRCDIEIN